MSEQCKQMVNGTGTYGSFNRYRCQRKAVQDGYCWQHKPESKEKRVQKRLEKFEKRRKYRKKEVFGSKMYELLKNSLKMMKKEGLTETKLYKDITETIKEIDK